MQFQSKFVFDSSTSEISYAIIVIDDSVFLRFAVNLVAKIPVPKSQTKPFYIGTKEASSETCLW